MAYDGPTIYRAPYASADAFSNFQRTVLDGLPVEEIGRHSQKDFETEPVRVWGTTVKGSWKTIEPGDYLIFYRDGQYGHAAEVVDTEENESLGRALWPNFDEDPWNCIIYLGEPIELDFDSATLHNWAGYDVTHTQNFGPLSDMGLGAVRAQFGSVGDFIHADHESTPAVAEGQATLPGSDDEVGSPEIDIHTVPDATIPDSVLSGLYFPNGMEEEILSQINSALTAGKHIIFIGPPGTGKTEIAQRVSQYLVENNPDIYTGYKTTTATADWSTFETAGGYMPGEGATEELLFSPGQVLRCFKNDGEQRNELLVIDEVNRSDIDKSFGQLFTLLSGRSVELPFTVEKTEVEVVPAERTDGGPRQAEYVMPSSWRIFATMNSYDKTSLYEMSYAFMRRFAFVHVGAPSGESTDDWVSLVESYAETWDITADTDVLEAVAAVWRITNGTVSERKIGPALVEDMLRHVSGSDSSRGITSAVTSYVFPQLEGVRGRGQVIDELASLEVMNRDILAERASEILQVELDE